MLATARPEPAACEAAWVQCLAVPGDAIARLRRFAWPYHLPQLSGRVAKVGKPWPGGSSACFWQRVWASLWAGCSERGTVWGCFPSASTWQALLDWAGRMVCGQSQVFPGTGICSCKRCVAGFCVLPCTRLHQGWLRCPERIWDVPSACPCWRAVMAPCLWQLCHAARGLRAPSSGSCARLLCCTRQVSPGWAWLFPFSRWMGTDCRGRHDHQALPFPGGFPK